MIPCMQSRDELEHIYTYTDILIAGTGDALAPTNKSVVSFLGMLTNNAKFLPNVWHTLHLHSIAGEFGLAEE